MKIVKNLVLACAAILVWLPDALTQSTEAPAGFDNLTNGFLSQAEFDSARTVFEEREGLADGLGPVYNAQSCAECHQTPVSGATSQVTELRAGHFDTRLGFQNPPGGSLINDRAIRASFQEVVPAGNEVRTLRTSLNALGDGFVECIADDTLRSISQQQPATMRGQVVLVPILEGRPGTTRVGRFGWKDQHASLVSFSADAYLNEMGITTPAPFFPQDNTSNGRIVSDGIADPEDDGADVETFASFMRSTKAPAPDRVLGSTFAAQAGSALFNSVGCVTCHVRSIPTARPGTALNGGTFIVPPALGDKVIHPFSDFLLHNVGTGDGIVQNGPATTRTKMRTVPLWGLRTRSRFMHDGLSVTLGDAILRHGGEAAGVTNAFRGLSATRRNQLLAFLASL
jgi:CxxC motif-containing protein (DUF1111 family)